MDLSNSILEYVRETVLGSASTSDFDTDLISHINAAIGKLNQNGVGNFIMVTNETQTWNDLIDPLQVEGNKYFQMVPQFISLSTKLLFDPPPPSSVQYHSDSINQLLWRLKIAYEEPPVTII